VIIGLNHGVLWRAQCAVISAPSRGGPAQADRKAHSFARGGRHAGANESRWLIAAGLGVDCKHLDQSRHLSDKRTAKSGMKAIELQQRVTQPRVYACKLLEVNGLDGPLWIRRVLVRAQEGQ